MNKSSLLHCIRIGMMTLILICLSGCSIIAALRGPQGEHLPPVPKTTVQLGDGVTMEFVLVPAGTFTMGSDSNHHDEGPQHKVTFLQPFYMARYPVTEQQWQKVMESKSVRFKDADKPKTEITWYESLRFLAKLKKLFPDQEFRLPTEAQWEYACRAGSTNDSCCGDSEQELPHYAWYNANAEGETHPVGLKRGNAWGLYDMHGNVWQWCADMAHDTYKSAPSDGSAWTMGPDDLLHDYYRIIRGGSAVDDSSCMRCAKRSYAIPDHTAKFIGLRVAVVLPEKKKH